MRYWIYVIGILVIFASCKKEKTTAELTPIISIASISSTEVTQFKDSIIIFLTFEDSDGDLGRQNPDDNSLWIKDDRVAAGETYHLPPIVGDNDKNTRGTIRIFIPSLFLFGNGNQEKTKLAIRIQDQAGNWSESIVTPLITVNK